MGICSNKFTYLVLINLNFQSQTSTCAEKVFSGLIHNAPHIFSCDGFEPKSEKVKATWLNTKLANHSTTDTGNVNY